MANILGYGLIKILDNGTHKPTRRLYVKDNGQWVDAKTAWIKENDVWVRVYPTPEAVGIIAPLFKSVTVVYTDSSALYPIIVSNSGTETLTVNKITVLPETDKFVTRIDLSRVGGKLPVTVAPGTSKIFSFGITGSKLPGTGKTSIVFDVNNGELGNGTLTSVVNGEVLPPFSLIQLPTDIQLTYDAAITRQPMVIYNKGYKELTIRDISSQKGLVYFENVPQAIAPGASATVTVVFDGKSYQLAGANLTDSIVILSDSLSNPTATVPCTLTVMSHGSLVFTADATWTTPVNAPTAGFKFWTRGGTGGRGAANGTQQQFLGGLGSLGSTFAFTASVPAGTIGQIAIGGNGGDGAYTATGYRSRGGSNSLNKALGGNSGQITPTPLVIVPFTTAGANTFEVPPGVSTIYVTTRGGGGGGGGGCSGAGDGWVGGGGGSGYSSHVNVAIAVTPGQKFPLFVGAGGAGGAAGPSVNAGGGGTGGTSSFNGAYASAGGGGGLGALFANYTVRAGGTGAFNGSAGATAFSEYYIGGNGGGTAQAGYIVIVNGPACQTSKGGNSASFVGAPSAYVYAPQYTAYYGNGGGGAGDYGPGIGMAGGVGGGGGASGIGNVGGAGGNGHVTISYAAIGGSAAAGAAATILQLKQNNAILIEAYAAGGGGGGAGSTNGTTVAVNGDGTVLATTGSNGQQGPDKITAGSAGGGGGGGLLGGAGAPPQTVTNGAGLVGYNGTSGAIPSPGVFIAANTTAPTAKIPAAAYVIIEW